MYLILCFNFYFIDTLFHNPSSPLQYLFPSTVRKENPLVHTQAWVPHYHWHLSIQQGENSKNVETLTFVLNQKDGILTGGTAAVFHIFFFSVCTGK